MKLASVILFALLMTRLAGANDLPFDREIINRYSLDGLPRTLSIRQGVDVWTGWDLERAKLFKAWQAPEGKAGLIQSGFVTRSAGTKWYEDTSDETWRLQRDGKEVHLTIRYLGCSQRETAFELSWELRHDEGAVTLRQRISIAAASSKAARVFLEIVAEGLAPEENLLLPDGAQKVWKLTPADSEAVTALTVGDWHQLTLP